MGELIQQFNEVVHAMWNRRWAGALVAWLVAIVGAVGLTLVPNRYDASGRVYVNTKSVLRPLLNDLAVQPDLDQTIALLARTLITRPNVEMLIRSSGLDLPGTRPGEREAQIETLMRDIKVSGSGRDNIFTFTYRDTDPVRARLLVQNLVGLFLDSDSGANKRDAQSARSFIEDQIKSYESRLAEAEGRLKAFRLRNLGVTDVAGKDFFARIGALTEELAKQTVELRAAEQSRDALKLQLQGETMSLVPDTPPPSPVMTAEVDPRLEAQRKLLDELLRRYTDLHPDVVATKRLIVRLEDERQRELDAKRATAESRPVKQSVALNPVMQQVRLAMAEADGSVAALRVRVADTQGRLGQMRASASRVPQVEAELTQLNRDYDVIRRAYETMVARREKASLSEDVDATRPAQFRVIDPPRTTPQPVFPNRLALAPVVLLLALVAGLGTAFLLVQLRPTYSNARALRFATQRIVLGSVSMMIDAGMLRRKRLDLFAFGSTACAFLLVGGAWVAWVAMQVRA